MRRLPSRFSDWVVAHPVWWVLASGAILVIAGLALELPPIVVIAAAAAVAGLNILHARRRGYCPVPEAPGPRTSQAEGE